MSADASTPVPRLRAMRAAAEAAVRFVEPEAPLGIGTGRTASEFIAALAASDRKPEVAAASSLATAALMRDAGIEVAALREGGRLALYVDGADAADPALRLVKGGGGAHAGEKRLAYAADLFVCIVDDTKLRPSLAGHVVPIEVLPPARFELERTLARAHGRSVLREGFVTDGGNPVVDVSGLDLRDPAGMEDWLESLPGVVACGIFAKRPADVLLVGHNDGTVDEIERS